MTFSVVVDDVLEGIDWIIRGQDILPATAPQIHLAQILGAKRRQLYLHHPLVLGEDGQKLAKRLGSFSLRAMLEKGQTVEQLMGQAALAVGLLPRYRPLKRTDVKELFL